MASVLVFRFREDEYIVKVYYNEIEISRDIVYYILEYR